MRDFSRTIVGTLVNGLANMGWDQLTAQQQKFAKKYLKTAAKLGGDSNTVRDDIADRITAWDDLKKQAMLCVDNLPKELGRKALHKNIKAADKIFRGNGKVLDEANGKPAMQAALAAAQKAAMDFGSDEIAKADAALDKIRGYFGAVKALPDLKDRRNGMDTAMAKPLPDLEKVRAGRVVIENAEARLKAWHDKLVGDYDKTEKELLQVETVQLQAYKGTPAERFNDPIKAEHAKVRAKMLEGAPVSELELVAQAGKALNSQALKLLSASQLFPLKKAEQERRLADLPSDRKSIASTTAELKQVLDDAVSEAGKGDFDAATECLRTVSDKLTDMRILVAMEDRYQEKSDQVRKRVSTLKDNPGAAYARKEVGVVTTAMDKAQALAATAAQKTDALAASRDYEQAIKCLEVAEAACDLAEDAANRMIGVASALANVGKGDASADVVKTEAVLKRLEGHKDHLLAATQIAAGQAALKDARGALSGGEEARAEVAVARASVAILEGWQLAETYGHLCRRLDTLDADLAKLAAPGPVPTAIASELKRVTDACAAARAEIDRTGPAAADLLDTAGKAFAQATALANRHTNYLAERQKVAGVIAQAKQAKISDAEKRVTEMDARIDAADREAAAMDHDTADTYLSVARSIAEAALLSAKVRGKEKLDPDALSALVAAPGGIAALDGIMIGLKAKDVRMDAMVDLLAARFDMKVEVFRDYQKNKNKTDKYDDDMVGAKPALDKQLSSKKSKNLLLYYQAMIKVPESHARLNDSLKEFQQIEKGNEADYSGGKKRIRMMVCYGKADDAGNPLNNPDSLPEIEDACRAVPDDEVPNPNYGRWTTLHEVGHAVDDQKGFMKKNGKTAAYGSWVEYGSNVYSVAEAAASHFKFDHVYIEAKLTGGDPEAPDVPFHLEEADGEQKAQATWATRKSKVDEWVAAIRTGAELWESGAGSQKHALDTSGGKRVFHEAYNDHWVSYDLAARKKGMTGYQFRAPGEWFSELYAAYHTGKMKKSHPSYGWLAQL